jgi:large subunit ribosomal protein L24
MVVAGDKPVRREKIGRELGAKEKARAEKRKAAK